MPEKCSSLLSSLPQPASHTEPISSLLRSCISSKALTHGQCLHDRVIRCGCDGESMINTLVLQLYFQCGALDDAIRWFERMPERDNILAWNLVIGSCIQKGENHDALQFYEEMQHRQIDPDGITFIQVLAACTSLENGVRVYHKIKERGFEADTIVGTALVTMFSNHGDTGNAEKAFDNILIHNVISWNALLSVCARSGQTSKALIVFGRMQQEGISPDRISFVNVFTACARNQACIDYCKRIHACAIHLHILNDNKVATALICMYGKQKLLTNARAIFDEIRCRNIISWNAMITVYAQQGYSEDAFKIYNLMHLHVLMPDKVTFISLLDACDAPASLFQSRLLHLRILERKFSLDVVLVTSLINAYGKCGDVNMARALFDAMTNKNIITWNALISAHAHHGNGREALQLITEMQTEGVMPNEITFIEAFSACGSEVALDKGKLLHCHFIQSGFTTDDVITSSLISMYGKCGNVFHATKAFSELQNQTANSWNALIGVYGLNGDAEQAIKCFEKMICEHVTPNDITFVSILAACSHAGLLYEGYYYFGLMLTNHTTQQSAEHYDCMIDLLCRVGLSDHATYLTKNMPYKPTIISWTSLLCSAENWQLSDLYQFLR